MSLVNNIVKQIKANQESKKENAIVNSNEFVIAKNELNDYVKFFNHTNKQMNGGLMIVEKYRHLNKAELEEFALDKSKPTIDRHKVQELIARRDYVEQQVLKQIEKNPKILRTMFDFGLKRKTIGFIGAEYGMENLVNRVLEDKVASTMQNSYWENLGMYCCKWGLENCAKKAMDNHEAINQFDYRGYDMGMVACENEMVEATKYYFEKDFDINHRSSDNNYFWQTYEIVSKVKPEDRKYTQRVLETFSENSFVGMALELDGTRDFALEKIKEFEEIGAIKLNEDLQFNLTQYMPLSCLKESISKEDQDYFVEPNFDTSDLLLCADEEVINFDTSGLSLREDKINFDTSGLTLCEDEEEINFDTSGLSPREDEINFDTSDLLPCEDEEEINFDTSGLSSREDQINFDTSDLPLREIETIDNNLFDYSEDCSGMDN